VSALAARLATLPALPDVDDSILFVNGVIRFSVKEMRPHWPGYPVYIGVGKLFAAIVGDPVLALHLVSAVSSVLIAWPLAFVAREWARSLGASEDEAGVAGWVAAALWLVTPMAWVTASQIISDPLGLLVALLVLALAVAGERSDGDGALAWTAAAVTGGALIGVRLVDVTMLGPILWKAWADRDRRWWGLPPFAILAAGLVAGMLPWALVLAGQGMTEYVQAGQDHVTGHFTHWGRSAATDANPLARPFTALRTFALYGLGAGLPSLGWARVGSALGWTGIGALAIRQRWRSRVALLVALWFVPDFVYLSLGHDVAFPRYLLPVVPMAALCGGIAVARRPRPGLAAAALAVLGMAVVSHHLALSRRDHPLVEIAAARFLGRQPRAVAIAAVDVPTLALYLSNKGPSLAYAETTPSEIPTWLRRWAAQGREVFLTEPPLDPTGWRPVAHFCLDPLVDPRPPRELWLFAREPVADDEALHGCDGL
jgi:hypothetical protein